MNELRSSLHWLVLAIVNPLAIGANRMAEAETPEFNNFQLYVMAQHESQTSGGAADAYLPTVMLDISKLVVVGTVGSRPAEWLYWQEVVKPLRTAGRDPDSALNYIAIGDLTIPSIIHVQYSPNELPRELLHISENPSFSIPAWTMFVSGADEPRWLVSKASTETTRCLLVRSQKVREQSTGRMGVLHTATTHVLQRDHSGQQFSWLLKHRNSQFVPALK